MGIDDTGLIVGRNQIVLPGEMYKNVDIYEKLVGLPAKAAAARDMFAHAAGAKSKGIAQVMFYGELVVNGKYDYTKTGIYLEWLCFGVLLRPETTNAKDEDRLRDPQFERCCCCRGLGSVHGYGRCPLCEGAGFHCGPQDPPENHLSLALRAAGYNARPKQNKVLVAANERLFTLLHELGVPTVVHGYHPSDLSGSEWAAHDGTGPVACFNSMRALLTSDWAQRFLMPAHGSPCGEGLVVASEADARLFKWKHAGEGLGKVPEKLAKATAELQKWANSSQASLLPPGLVQAFERLRLVAQTQPKPSGSSKEKAEKVEKKGKKGQATDAEALAAWESTLTKYDSLEALFAKGPEAKVALEMELIAQITADLEKDYEVESRTAQQRAMQMVKSEVGRAYGMWIKNGKGSDRVKAK